VDLLKLVDTALDRHAACVCSLFPCVCSSFPCVCSSFPQRGFRINSIHNQDIRHSTETWISPKEDHTMITTHIICTTDSPLTPPQSSTPCQGFVIDGSGSMDRNVSC